MSREQKVFDQLEFAVRYARISRVLGNVLEFGTYSGQTAYVLAQAMNACNYPGELHLFDSFQGLPPAAADADKKCSRVADGTWREGTFVGMPADQLLDTVKPLVKAEVHAGWFKDTVPKFTKTAGVIHVDCDLYLSTMQCLEPLFEKGLVLSGATILFDDWFCTAEDEGQQRAWRELVGKYGVNYEHYAFYGACSRQVIVKTYYNR